MKIVIDISEKSYSRIKSDNGHCYCSLRDDDEKIVVTAICGGTPILDNAPTVEPEKTKEGELVKAYTKGFDTGVETVRPQGKWKREEIEYAIETSACTFHNGKTYYEKEDLMKSIEELGLFEDKEAENENN